MTAYWPVLDVRLRVGDLDLRPVTDADHDELARLLPADLELDPSAPRFPGLDEATSRATVMQQSYWRYYGTWTPDAWRLNFVVRTDGRLLGMQELEGNDFARLRTVDTSSWLVPEARGVGHGKAMRRAVLALAFGPLDAQVAITEAWHDNHASLAVSRALGYLPNGEAMHRRDDGVDTMLHLRLTRADWLASGQAAEIDVSGVEAALPFFGA